MLYRIIIFILFSLFLIILTETTFIQTIIYISVFWTLLRFIDNIGTKVLFLDIIVLLALVQWLLGAAFAQSLGIEMSIDFNSYFALAIPGTIFFIVGLYLPTYMRQRNQNIMPKLKSSLETYYKNRQLEVIIFFIIGVVCWLILPYMPPSISYMIGLFSNFLFMAMGAMFFCEIKRKSLYFLLGFCAIMYNTLFIGMIGVSIFLLFTLFNIFVIAKQIKFAFWKKIVSFLIVLSVIAIFQSAKTEYRTKTWKITNTGISTEREIDTDPLLLLALVSERISDSNLILNKDFLVDFIGRFNQGHIISYTMAFVPSKEPFANGEVTLWNTLVAFIPRILWKDKPEIATGLYFERFTGIKLGKFHSATLGALGDAYVDFGQFAFVFLFFYGLMFGYIFVVFYLESLKKPYLIIWGQVIFYATISIPEVSVTGILNFLFKFFLFFITIRFFQQLNKNIRRIKIQIA